MILYFLATGNSKYVTERIAEAIGTEAVSIQNMHEKILRDVSGIVSPTYAWGIPSLVDEFLRTHVIENFCKDTIKMDTLEAIEARYSCRAFQPDQISEDALDTILKAGMSAPPVAKEHQISANRV